MIHEEQLKLFSGALSEGKLSHAYIVEGAEGIGTFEFAKHAAKLLLCTGEKPPCGKCKSCVKADLDSHPDLLVFSSGEAGTFKVESIREMIKSVNLKPNESARKVYILDMAHKMTSQAQNALLKVFEEPPRDTVFFILTEKRDALLPTVISRGQIITLAPFSTDEVLRFLKKKYPKKNESELALAARMSGGNPGEAEKLLDKTSASERERAKEFIWLVLSKNSKTSQYDVFSFLSPLKAKRENALRFLEMLLYVLRDIYIKKVGADTQYAFLTLDEADKLSENITVQSLKMIIDAVTECAVFIESNGNLNAALTELCALINNVKDKR